MQIIYRRTEVGGYTWDQIAESLQEGHLSVVKAGDEIPIKLKNGETHIVVATPDQNDKWFFVFKDAPFECRFGKTSKWDDSEIRKRLRDFVELLPDNLRGIIKPQVTRQRYDGNWFETIDELFIPSGRQVFGWDDEEENPEESQFEIFKDRRNRCKDLDGEGEWWWLRSAGSYTGAYTVTSSGTSASNGTTNGYAVVPSFCI